MTMSGVAAFDDPQLDDALFRILGAAVADRPVHAPPKRSKARAPRRQVPARRLRLPRVVIDRRTGSALAAGFALAIVGTTGVLLREPLARWYSRHSEPEIVTLSPPLRPAAAPVRAAPSSTPVADPVAGASNPVDDAPPGRIEIADAAPPVLPPASPERQAAATPRPAISRPAILKPVAAASARRAAPKPTIASGTVAVAAIRPSAPTPSPASPVELALVDRVAPASVGIARTPQRATIAPSDAITPEPVAVRPERARRDGVDAIRSLRRQW